MWMQAASSAMPPRHTEQHNRIQRLGSGQSDLVADGEAHRAKVGLDGVGLEISSYALA